MSQKINASATVSVACSCMNELGEGPVWDEKNERLLWLDILEQRLFQLDPVSGKSADSKLDTMITSLALSQDGALFGTSANGLERIEPGTGETRLQHAIEQGVSGNRSNDGKCDPQGRYWFGTMNNSEVHRTGALYSIDTSLRLKKHVEGLGIPNTLAWSPGGEFFYFADSMAQTIWRYPWSASTGDLGAPEVFVSLQGIGHDASIFDFVCKAVIFVFAILFVLPLFIPSAFVVGYINSWEIHMLFVILIALVPVAANYAALFAIYVFVPSRVLAVAGALYVDGWFYWMHEPDTWIPDPVWRWFLILVLAFIGGGVSYWISEKVKR